jgi:arylsulfatase A-like enzyme
LVHNTLFTAFVPRRSLLSFGLAAGGQTPGRRLLQVTIRSDGRTVGERTLDLRTASFRQESVAFDGPGRQSAIEVSLRLTDPSGAVLPQSGRNPAAVTDPTLFDRDAPRGVVLVSIDTLRRDHVGLYGYALPTTPHLDEFGRSGIVFRDAVSVSSWTLPAHLSMLTSVEPAAHGGVDGHHGFNRSVPTLAQTLRRSGFATHAVTSHLYVSPTYGVDVGFDRFDYEPERDGADVADRAIAALDGFGVRPFFLFVHFYDAHWPYAAPLEDRRVFAAPEPSSLGPLPPAESRPRDPRPLGAAYDAEIHYADRQLGRILDHLKRTGLLRHTLVAVTSDHGEEFGEHGGYEHLRTLYEEVIRVPLVLGGLDLQPRIAQGQVSLLDLAPTILEALGLPAQPSHRGRSLLGALVPKDAYGETDASGFVGPRRTRKLFLRSGMTGGKLVLTLDRGSGEVLKEEWFDLARDPREASRAPLATNISTHWRDRLLRRWLAARSLGPERPAVTHSREQRARLRSLGYLGP